jgi:hypothetical protein
LAKPILIIYLVYKVINSNPAILPIIESILVKTLKSRGCHGPSTPKTLTYYGPTPFETFPWVISYHRPSITTPWSFLKDLYFYKLEKWTLLLEEMSTTYAGEWGVFMASDVGKEELVQCGVAKIQDRFTVHHNLYAHTTQPRPLYTSEWEEYASPFELVVPDSCTATEGFFGE